MDWKITQNGTILKEGYPCDVREHLETMVEEETGLFLSMQEDEEEGFIYLHSEYAEDLTDEEVEKVSNLGISEDYDETTIQALEKLLNVKIDTPV